MINRERSERNGSLCNAPLRNFMGDCLLLEDIRTHSWGGGG